MSRYYDPSPKAIWLGDIRVAKELCYPKSVIEALEKEPDERKRACILHDAFLKSIEENW